MQWTVWKEATELPDNVVGLLLKPEHFQALMIETVNRILEAPMVG